MRGFTKKLAGGAIRRKSSSKGGEERSLVNLTGRRGEIDKYERNGEEESSTRQVFGPVVQNAEEGSALTARRELREEIGHNKLVLGFQIPPKNLAGKK